MYLKRSASVTQELLDCFCNDCCSDNWEVLNCGKEKLKSRRAEEKIPTASCSLERQVKSNPPDPGSDMLAS